MLTAAMRELRPWKNGGGRTSEVVSLPIGARLNDFGWRINIADIDADGPFFGLSDGGTAPRNPGGDAMCSGSH